MFKITTQHLHGPLLAKTFFFFQIDKVACCVHDSFAGTFTKIGLVSMETYVNKVVWAAANGNWGSLGSLCTPTTRKVTGPYIAAMNDKSRPSFLVLYFLNIMMLYNKGKLIKSKLVNTYKTTFTKRLLLFLDLSK